MNKDMCGPSPRRTSLPVRTWENEVGQYLKKVRNDYTRNVPAGLFFWNWYFSLESMGALHLGHYGISPLTRF